MAVGATGWMGAACACLALLSACGEPAAPVSDAAPEADAEAAPEVARPEIPWLDTGELSWPGGRAEDCGPGEAHFVGETGCAPVGSPCPSGDFPEGLPADQPVVHVLSAAPTGGDGSAERPYATLQDFGLGGLGSGTVVAMGRGRYDATLRLPDGITLRGACAAETELSSTDPHGDDGVITVIGAGVEVRDLRIGPSPRPGVTLRGDGVEASLSGIDITGATIVGLGVFSRASTSVEGIVIRDTAARSSDGQFGRGVNVELGGRLMARRGAFIRNRDVAVVAGGEAGAPAGAPVTELGLEDVVIRDTRARTLDGGGGRGLESQLAARVDLRRGVIERNRDVGVISADPGSTLALTDVVVRDTEGQMSDATRGRGLSVQRRAALEATRTVVERSRDIAVIVSDLGSTVMLTDVVVRETQSQEADGMDGRAMSVQLGASLRAMRLVLADNRGFGISAMSAETAVELSEVRISRTAPVECGDDACPELGAGTGLGAYASAMLSVDRFAVEDAALCGVHVALFGDLDLAQGLVSGCLIGACVQVDGYDIERLTGDVRYMGNGTQLDTTELPVPDLATFSPSG